MTSPGPASGAERIGSIDVVRGFALWGVLLINMMNFVGPPSGRLDMAAGWVATIFFKQKSWRLFAFLFGLGFAMLLDRWRAQPGGFLPRYARRLATLFLFGLANYLFYFGDVLAPYALLGALLLVARDWPPKLLLASAVVLLLLHPLEALWTTYQAPAISQLGPPGRPPAGGSVVDLWAAQAPHLPAHVNPLRHLTGNESWLAFFAMFLLGRYAGRRRLWNVTEHEPLLRRVFTWGFTLGIGAMLAHGALVSLVRHALPPPVELVKRAVWAYGATALAVSYGAGLILLLRSERWRQRLAPLGAMGRMALSVYLAQSVIFTTVFFGYGLGLDQKAGPAAIFGIAFLIYATQLVICSWWAARFRFGPAEWLWRSVTYGRLQPML